MALGFRLWRGHCMMYFVDGTPSDGQAASVVVAPTLTTLALDLNWPALAEALESRA